MKKKSRIEIEEINEEIKRINPIIREISNKLLNHIARELAHEERKHDIDGFIITKVFIVELICITLSRLYDRDRDINELEFQKDFLVENIESIYINEDGKLCCEKMGMVVETHEAEH